MTVSEVKAGQFLASTSSEILARKHVTAVKSNEDSYKDKDQERGSLSSAIQDQVTLSKEAQALATAISQSPTDNLFQSPSSSFDR